MEIPSGGLTGRLWSLHNAGKDTGLLAGMGQLQ